MKKNLCHTKAACACFMTSILLFGYAFSPLTSLEMTDNYAAAFGAEDKVPVAPKTEDNSLEPKGDAGVTMDSVRFIFKGIPDNGYTFDNPINKDSGAHFLEESIVYEDDTPSKRQSFITFISNLEDKARRSSLHWDFNGTEQILDFVGWMPRPNDRPYCINTPAGQYDLRDNQAKVSYDSPFIFSQDMIGWLQRFDKSFLEESNNALYQNFLESHGIDADGDQQIVELTAVYMPYESVSLLIGDFNYYGNCIDPQILLLPKNSSITENNEAITRIKENGSMHSSTDVFDSLGAFQFPNLGKADFPFGQPLTNSWVLRYDYTTPSKPAGQPKPPAQPALPPVPVAGNTGIKANSSTIPSGSTMDASENPSQENKTKLEDEMKKANGGNAISGAKFYEINLKGSDGQNIHDGFGSIELQIPVDPKYNGRRFTFWHLHQNGTITKHKVTAKDGFITITVTDLSTFAYALDTEEATAPAPTEDTQTPAAQNPQDPAKQTTAGLTNTGDTLRDTLPKTSDNLKIGYMLIATTLALTAGFLLVGSSIAQFARKKLTKD